jgi:hypothetical protein
MKKILTAGLLALSAALITDQQASAWVNCKFGVGLNWNWQSGGNNFLWGAFRNGQPPCPDVAYPGGGGGYPGHGAPTFPGVQPYGPQDFQYFGQQRNGANPAAPATPAVQQPAANNQVSLYGDAAAYQQVGYSYPANNPYYYYYYPQSYYGYQVPSYWYGR